MDTLFNAVNKAWLASAYPQSKACTSAAYKQTTRGGGNGASGSGSGSGTSGSGSGTGSGSGSGNGSRSMVAPDWSCSYCAGKIRLISITGGSLDTLVHPTITRLDGLAPLPRNLTRERATPANTNANSRFLSAYIGPIVKYMSPVHVVTDSVKMILSMLGVGSTSNASHTSNATAAAVVGKEEISVEVESSSSSCALNGTCVNPSQPSPSLSKEGDGVTVEDTDSQNESNKVKPPPPPAASSSSSPAQTFLTMTMNQWHTDMAQYQEPSHMSLLTTQLTDVGFPVDHKVHHKSITLPTRSYPNLSLHILTYSIVFLT